MTRNSYIVKARTNEHKQTDVLLYVSDGCGLNNCYSKCNKQQEKYCVSRAKIYTLCNVDKIWIGPDRTGSGRTGSQIGSQKKKIVLKKKENQKNQIVYKIVINKK